MKAEASAWANGLFQTNIKVAFLVLLLSAWGHGSNAQSALKAGTLPVGASLHYWHINSSRASDGRAHDFSLGPSLSVLVTNKLAVGASLEYNTTRYSARFPAGVNQVQTRLQVGPFATYYQMLTHWFGLTGTLFAGYEHSAYPEEQAVGNYTIVANGFVTSLTPGAIFFPVSRLGIGASIGNLNYQWLASKPYFATNYDSSTYSGWATDFGLPKLTFSGTYFVGH